MQSARALAGRWVRRFYPKSAPAPAPGAASPAQPPKPSPVPPPSATSLGDYTHYAGMLPRDAGETGSRVFPLYSEAQATQAIVELKARLQGDESAECREALRGPFAAEIRSRCDLWFQRIDFPEYGIASTSDPELAYMDEGSFNTLGRRLTSREACLLRPWPKWYYVRPLLPRLEGKSVLEIGSSHGFFSFQFAAAGAREVTGIEIVRQAHTSSLWARDVLGFGNVRFLHTDFLLDPAIRRHDIVFLSEVHNHFLFPFYGLLKLVNLAQEMLILDTASYDTELHGVELSSGWHHASGRIIYHSFHLTHGMILDFLQLIGVQPSSVTCYRAPDDPVHSLYLIDTRGLEKHRTEQTHPEYLLDLLKQVGAG